MTLVLPGLDGTALWQRRHRGDAAARALADRHYSRQAVGGRTIGGPGRVLVLVSPCERAIWLTAYSTYPADRLDAWRCSIFRNEGAGQSSTLIAAAMEITSTLWGEAPSDGWVTWVDTAKVNSRHPGYCFNRAGWRLDRDFVPDRRRPTMIRLRCP